MRLVSDGRVDEQDDDARYIHEAHRLNEQAAYWCGVGTLMQYMATECKHYKYSEGALERIREEFVKSGMEFPLSLNGVSYSDSAIRGLFFFRTL